MFTIRIVERQLEILGFFARDQAIAIQRTAALGQVLHGDGDFVNIFGHCEIQEWIAAGAAAALNREDILGKRLVAGRVELLAGRIVDRDDAFQRDVPNSRACNSNSSFSPGSTAT